MIITLEKQVCDLEYAKKFKELGISQESLYCWYKFSDGWRIASKVQPNNKWECLDNTYSAFTVAELGEMLPVGTVIEKWDQLKYKYRCYNERYNKIMYEITEADARAKMLIWLIENKHLEVSK